MHSDQCPNQANRDAAEGAQAETRHIEQADDPAAHVDRRMNLHEGLSHGVKRQFEKAGGEQKPSANQ